MNIRSEEASRVHSSEWKWGGFIGMNTVKMKQDIVSTSMVT